MKKKVTVGDFRFTPDMQALINKVIESNRLTYGEMSKSLERYFSLIHNCKHGIISNSGTSSLVVAIQALKEIHGWEDGDEIICPSVTFVATINAVLHNNLTPVLVDVDDRTYNLNADIISLWISERTRAIMPVHAFGLPADMTAINEAAQIYNLKVIEDSCECAFVDHAGQKVGSLSDVGVFSFYVAHILTAGVGGMAITNNPELAVKMRSLVNHGWNRESRPVDIETFSLDEIRSRYYFTSIGHSFRLTEFEAAIGLAQLYDWEGLVRRRREVADLIWRGLARLQIPSLQLPILTNNSCMMFPIVWHGGVKWDLISHLEKNGVETREMLPLVGQPCYADRWSLEDYPIANIISKHGFYIGCHQYLSYEDIDHIISTFRTFFEETA